MASTRYYYYFRNHWAAAAFALLFLVRLSLSLTSSVSDVLPTVHFRASLSELSDASLSDDDLRVLADASKEYGACFVSVTVSPGDFDFEAWSRAADKLFASDDLRQASYVRDGGVFRRGYVEPLGESGSASLYEVKEGFSYGHQWERAPDEINALTGQNIWPASFSQKDKDSLLRWYDMCNALSMALVRSIAAILGLDSHELDKYFLQSAHEVSLARLFRYFGRDSTAYKETCPKEEVCTGSSPHTDWGFLTLVMQQESAEVKETSAPSGSLQLWNASSDKWKDLTFAADDGRPHQGTFLVNFGDYLSLLTNGTFASPLHRVTLGPSSRLSAVFFFYPDFDAEIPSFDSPASLSLLQDQSQSCEDDHRCAESTQSSASTFGAFIGEKWASVTKK